MLKPGRYELVTFRHREGAAPFDEWITGLDPSTRQRILSRVFRMKAGQFGDYKHIDQQLYELRLFFGPGYRVYFGEQNGTIIILLTGGDKSSQKRDIKKATELWRMHLKRKP